MTEKKTNLQAAKEFAEFGLAEKAAGRRQSASGPGSTNHAAKQALQLIRQTIKRHKIQTILDLGCGDWNWMYKLGLPTVSDSAPTSYVGWESSETLVNQMNRKYGLKGQIDFHVKDITTCPLPKVDLIIARDVLFHLPLELSTPLVDNIRNNCRFLISTSFISVLENGDIGQYMPIEGWGFHKINLSISPFNLAPNLDIAVRESVGKKKGHNRYICLYNFSSA